MAYSFDQYDQALVIDGFANGIADNPYDGISDERNVNVISVPGEASVGFATQAVSSVAVTNGTVTSVAGSSVLTITGASGFYSGMALSFTSIGGYSGIVSGTTVYWITKQTGNSFILFSDYEQANQVTVTGSGNAGFLPKNVNFSNYTGTQPNKTTRSIATGNTFMVDSIGQVWSDRLLAGTFWKFTGNVVHSGSFVGDTSNGNGIVYLKPTGANGYVFVFSDSSIDYFQEQSPLTWKYGWTPATASVSNGAIVAPYLQAGAASGASHEALVGQDNVVYFCDATQVDSFFEKPGQTFDPLTHATYTYNTPALALPLIDQAICLAELGVNLLVGGIRNFIYPWNRVATSFTYPILLAESVTQKMITVNTNTFLFTGDRGRIYVTNGSQANLWKKIPDHLSGTVEPYYRWGNVSFSKNQMYFSALGTTNSGSALSVYGGIWAVDMDTLSIRLLNQLSYGTYAGYCPALQAIVPIPGSSSGSSDPVGYGIVAGWNSGAATYGIDSSSSSPYTGSQAYIDSDLIPIGTFNKPRDFQRLEYKLTKPMVSGESVTVQYRLDFSQNYTTIFTDSTVGAFSGEAPNGVNFKNAQWVQFRVILNSTATNPSYTRLKNIRITGLVGPTLQQSQAFSL